MDIHEDRITERRRGLTPFILLPRSLLLTAPPLLAPRWGAKLFRLRRKSPMRPSAPSSLVVLGGGREERRARKEKNGASRSPFSILRHIISPLWKTSSNSQGLPKQKKVDTFIYIIRPRVVDSRLETVRFRRSSSFCEGLWLGRFDHWMNWTNRWSHRHSHLLTPSRDPHVSYEGFTRLSVPNQTTKNKNNQFVWSRLWSSLLVKSD